MKKNILQTLSLAFCICVFSVQISAQVIADPGNDPRCQIHCQQWNQLQRIVEKQLFLKME